MKFWNELISTEEEWMKNWRPSRFGGLELSLALKPFSWTIGINYRKRFSFGSMGNWYDIWVCFFPIIFHVRLLVKLSDKKWDEYLHKLASSPLFGDTPG